jgi:dihydropteroate synthase
MIWSIKDGFFETGKHPLIMGIVNVTPDSFSDGGQYVSSDDAIRHGLKLVEEGADILDIGGESTRPGAGVVGCDDEVDRVMPVIKGLKAGTDVPISIDTCKAEVASRAIDAGVSIINDVSAMRFDKKMIHVASESGSGVVLMHMKGNPRNMQSDPEYQDVIGEIMDFLNQHIGFAEAGGIQRDKICIDPGIGFGKTLNHNLEIFRHLDRFLELGQPVLTGPSRKSFIGKLLNDAPVHERVEGSAAAVAASVFAGVHVIRVHDVKFMKRVAVVASALRLGRGES